ncbi:MAG: hypothetical protein MSC31_14095 [Solirubrobacteraceae bacterium MAG38_C4-C5]|nr:hypothetical protein [Candidatus Siliceabacter maunaloa]
MAAKRKAAKKAASAGSAITAAKENPYLQRIADDEDLRDNVRVAFEAARDAYGRLNNGKAPTKVLLDDKKFHKDLQRSAEAMRDVGDSLRTGKRKRKAKRGGMGLGTLLTATVVGGIVALVVSEDLRNKVLDMLFGAEEEFDYTSTTTPAGAPPPAQPVT